YLDVQGNGELFMVTPPAASSPPSGTFQVGYLDSPLNTQNGNYSILVTDRGKTLFRTGATGPFTWTLPQANTMPSAMRAQFVCVPGVTGAQSIAVAAGTLQWIPNNTTGTRTMATTGASAVAIANSANNTWYIWGTGLT